MLQKKTGAARCSVKEGVVKNFANFIGEHQYWSLLLINLQTFRSIPLLKRGSNTGVFLWNMRNFKFKSIYLSVSFPKLCFHNCYYNLRGMAYSTNSPNHRPCSVKNWRRNFFHWLEENFRIKTWILDFAAFSILFKHFVKKLDLPRLSEK